MPTAFVPPPPREPSPTTRELIYAYAGSQKVMVLVGAIFTVVGLVVTLGLGWGLPGELALTFLGRPMRAHVVDVHVDTSTEINGENPLTVRFTWDDAGAERTGTSTFTSRRETEFPAGRELDAEVVPMVHDWARLKGGTYSTFGLIALLFLLFPVVGIAVFASAVASNRREIRAYVHGVPADGTIVRAGEDTHTEINDRHPWKVEWEFAVEGQKYKGSLSNMNQAALQPLAVGTAVTVLYLREDPKVNTLYLD